VDDLIFHGASGPWCDIVLEEVEPSKWLHQGDMLVDIGIPMFKALLDMQNDPTAEIPVDVGTIVLMTRAYVASIRAAIYASRPSSRHSALQVAPMPFDAIFEPSQDT
jgi:hypothetical protein